MPNMPPYVELTVTAMREIVAGETLLETFKTNLFNALSGQVPVTLNSKVMINKETDRPMTAGDLTPGSTYIVDWSDRMSMGKSVLVSEMKKAFGEYSAGVGIVKPRESFGADAIWYNELRAVYRPSRGFARHVRRKKAAERRHQQ